METKFTTAGRQWKVDERVIVLSNHANSSAPRVLKIQRVNAKSITIDGERYRTDQLTDGVPTRRVGSGWGSFSLAVLPLDHPDARYRLAQRALYKAGRTVDAARKLHDRGPTADTAETLRQELGEWIQAWEAFQTEQAKHDGR